MPPQRLRRRLAAALLGLLLLPGPGAAQEISDPELFTKSLEAAGQALAQYGTWDARDELARVTRIGYRIARESGFTDFPLTFHLIDMAIPNAFALPGGQVFVTRGMLELGLDDQMLAALLGHEIAHVVMRHGLRMSKRATLLNAISQAVLVGVILGASSSSSSSRSPVYDPFDPRSRESGRGDVIQGTAAAGLVVSELLLRSYSREFEDEADLEGQRWAASAGYDPAGARTLMAKMAARIPESREYGYWRTHPFLEDRAEAAAARGDLLRVGEGGDADAFRRRTQEALLGYLEDAGSGAAELADLVKEQALAAWPVGPAAEEIRLAKLHRRRDAELARRPLYRDFGDLVAAYRDEIEVVAGLSPESPLVARLEKEIGELDAERRELLPDAQAVLEEGVYETEFLETFLSNFPDSERAPQVALALGEAYSRLGRQTDAVEQFLAAHAAAPQSEAGTKALRGLRNLAPMLSRLGALQRLAEQEADPELADLAADRLAEMAGTYHDMSNGAEYLERFPDGAHRAAVRTRLDTLADGLYGEVVLYRTVGDHAKALDRVHRILTHAPLSPAAEKLRADVVLKG